MPLSVTMSVTLVCLCESPSVLSCSQKAYCFDAPRLIYRMETEDLSESSPAQTSPTEHLLL